MKKLFVGNLSWTTSEDDLKEHFSTQGEVVSAKIVTDKMTGKSRGFGFVEMSDAGSAEKAVQNLDGQALGDRSLRVSLAQDRAPGERGERSNDRGGDSRGAPRRDRAPYAGNGRGFKRFDSQ